MLIEFSFIPYILGYLELYGRDGKVLLGPGLQNGGRQRQLHVPKDVKLPHVPTPYHLCSNVDAGCIHSRSYLVNFHVSCLAFLL